MSGQRPATDPDAEREIDLARWWRTLLAYWWLAAAGLVAGVVLSAVYALSGTTMYQASSLIARGQAFNPAGTATVLGYLSSPAAIQEYATATATVDTVAAKIGVSPGELRGHITVQTLTDVGTAATTNTNSILVQITVELNKPKKAEDAANALAQIIKKTTTSNYVTQSIAQYGVRLRNYAVRKKTLQERIDALNTALAHSPGLAPLDRLVLVSQLDSAEGNLGQTLDSITGAQQQLTLAEDVERTQIIPPPARARKLVQSRRNPILVGAVIGLLLGAIVALVYGLRASRTSTA